MPKTDSDALSTLVGCRFLIGGSGGSPAANLLAFVLRLSRSVRDGERLCWNTLPATREPSSHRKRMVRRAAFTNIVGFANGRFIRNVGFLCTPASRHPVGYYWQRFFSHQFLVVSGAMYWSERSYTATWESYDSRQIFMWRSEPVDVPRRPVIRNQWQGRNLTLRLWTKKIESREVDDLLVAIANENLASVGELTKRWRS